MKLKIIEIEGKQYAEINDGKPIYIHDDGKEAPFDAAGTVATISRLNGEAKGHRERAEKAEATLKTFDGIDDAAAAKKALETLKNLDAKKLVDAGEIERVKTEAIKAVEDKYAPVIAERDKLQASLVTEKIGGSFARSKFIAEKMAIPHDLVEARFGNAFKLEDNAVVAYDAKGNKLFSRANPGDPAGFDEALEILIEQYPYKDTILKGSGANGGGANGSGGANAGGNNRTRAEFEAMGAADQMKFVKEGGKIAD